MKDLTNSSIDRKNILNNNLVIPEVYEQAGFLGLKFDGKYRYTRQQIVKYYEVDSRTIDRLLENHKDENAKEYRQILKLNSKENVRNTMYSEVLDLVASFENGYADYLKKKYEKLGRKIYLSKAR